MHRVLPVVAMGFLSSFFGCNKPPGDAASKAGASQTPIFVSDLEYKQNRAKQIAMAPQTLEQLRGYGVTDDSTLKLEYFFYTNTKQKAESLAKELADRGYDGSHDVAAGNSSLYVVTG